jgi:DeoR family transcriptional regulator of aga operon
MLQDGNPVMIGTLADTLNVSAVTVRSDLAALERQQVLRRVRGGAMVVRPARFERPPNIPQLDFSTEKERIGKAAAARVRDGETIILDSGSTTLAMACALPETISDVVVLTNSLDIAVALHGHPGVDVIVTGGRLRKSQGRDNWRTLVPPLATLLLDEINADAAYLCCTGIDVRNGFTNGNWEEAELKKAMISSSRSTVFLADHDKIGHVGSARIASLSAVSALVTDDGAAAADVSALEAAGLTVVLA